MRNMLSGKYRLSWVKVFLDLLSRRKWGQGQTLANLDPVRLASVVRPCAGGNPGV